MIVLLTRYPKSIAWFFVALFYLDLTLMPLMTRGESRRAPAAARYFPGLWQSDLQKRYNVDPVQQSVDLDPVQDISAISTERESSAPFATGPTQPEMAAFSSVNSSNMVDLFSGDFSYNIPLLDVGGYPVNLGYRGGISMDQEASWVGTGWNINPGTITRNMRGLPDDFNGKNDSITKVMSIKENKTIGVTGGYDQEIVGLPQKDGKVVDTNYSGVSVGASLGIFYNNYKGWGLEHGLNASINSGRGAKGPLSGGLSITNNSQEGLTPSPSLSVSLQEKEHGDRGWAGSSYTISLPYNSRSGLKGLQLSAGVRQYGEDKKNQNHSYGSGISSVISFASPAYTPSINMPFTSRQFSFTGKVGLEKKVSHPSFFLSGYVSRQRIDPEDTLLALPSYGYLHFQDGARNRSALLDFNREKEIPYREKPAVAHIAVPQYTYDAFSITGEGTGGMFRAYRGDIGFVYDHAIRTKDKSDRISVDIGIGDMVHGGVDLNINRAFTQNGPWLDKNTMADVIDFRNDSLDFEAVYFRNPGEKSINSKAFYETIGGDDVVTVGLYQAGNSRSDIGTTNFLTKYRHKKEVGKTLLTQENAVKNERDKRTQVISYLTAKEADAAGLTKYIENYTYNEFDPSICGTANFDSVEGLGTGLPAYFYKSKDLKGEPSHTRVDSVISFDWYRNVPTHVPNFIKDKFSVRWAGRVRAPVTGTYTFTTTSDDGVRLWLNDSLVIDDWRNHTRKNGITHKQVNLVAGQLYKIKLEYYEDGGLSYIKLEWAYPGQTIQVIPTMFLYPPAIDTFKINNYLVKEKRVNRFRKENHISEITVLNSDGRRYIYGIPVYNLRQREATFSVNGKLYGNNETGLVKYIHGTDNTAQNKQGKDWYYNSEEIPAYAHSFLLTGIVASDYSDITGNGISDDDIGDAVKFNYSKICGIANPYLWRAPAATDSVTYNEGLKTDNRDDKGSYVYGEKELWYLHSIESKTMIATFVLEDRNDLPAIDERGNKLFNNTAKRLKEINLYSKADFMKRGVNARPFKTVHFEYSYELCPGVYGPGTGKLTLKKVWFTYNENEKGKQNPYEFHYNATNPSYNIKSYDRWGNYKDPLQNPGSSPANLITNAEYPYALQDSTAAAANAAAWTLDSIYLPSGGSIKVQYESDDYAYVQNKRAMQLFKIVGFNNSTALPADPFRLHTKQHDNLYVFVSVPDAVSNAADAYRKYLEDVEKFYFRLYVKMPSDAFGSGSEYISCYANLDADNSYGVAGSNVIWLKLEGISLKGDGPGNHSPLAKAAVQFLRMNLPSKAYPGSETGESLDLEAAVKMLAASGDNYATAFKSFDRVARERGWAAAIDTSRSYVRLNNPYYKKYGGGQRVKRVIVYDNWDRMTNQRAAIYGQEYIYTTRKEMNGVMTTISSGVASWEPGLGGEENPFHVPIEYVEKVAPLGPVTLGYTEEPLGESFFPSAGVGYSCVRTRTINYKDKKSANGYDETKFYTAYDFPVYTDRTLFDIDTKKRYKPALSNFLRINAKHYISLSQGFKIELNDMHGKLRTKASYAETDAVNPISYSENIYRVEDPNAEHKRLSNVVMAIHPDGSIDTTALIGKDVELMVDMREQLSITNGYNVNLNTEMFSIPFPTPPFFLIPSFLNLAQREENIYRSVATAKIIQRYGILDSAIQVDKGSKISTKDILYDSETGDVLLTRTQNEFNDYIYNFTYPSHWAYDGMGLAYKNIDVTVHHIAIRDGRIIEGLSDQQAGELFSSGDEIIVAGKQQTGEGSGCDNEFSTFPLYNKIWAIDSSVLTGGTKAFYFIDRYGHPYNGFDVSLKIIRSGRRNMMGAVGAVTSLDSLVKKNTSTGEYELVVNTASKVIATSASEFKQYWKVEDVKAKEPTINCLPNWHALNVRCVQENGVNTGYVEIFETDINPYSSTYNQTRWRLLWENCYICPKPSGWVATDSTRCATDSLGNYTGYIEQEEMDTASCSITFNHTRWVVTTQNCSVCPKPAGWSTTGNTRCAKDGSNNNTGYQEYEEVDTVACSATYNQTRWVTGSLNCTTCPKPAGWSATGNTRCAKDGSNNNTGYQEYEEIDTVNCSATYNQTRWVTGSLNCTTCPKPAGWSATGNTRCAKDGSNNNTGYQEYEETDTVACSATYNQTRWVMGGLNCTTCPRPAKWAPTGNTRCQVNSHDPTKITGNVQREEVDTATCSATYNQTRWETIGLDCVACAGGTSCPSCDSTSCTGVDKKCISNVCETGVLKCYNAVYNGINAPYLYTNYYRYQFSDGSWSTYETSSNADTSCFGGAAFIERVPKREDVAIQPDGRDKETMSWASLAKNHNNRSGGRKKETATEKFYRSVLPEEKYMLYRQQQENAADNK